MPRPARAGHLLTFGGSSVIDDVRITALKNELRTSTSAERRALILSELARMGVMQRADAPVKETR